MASSSMSNQQWRYDVFLSFRGEDTRRSFTAHLYDRLKDKRINVFMDFHLRSGEDISSQLKKTIRSSRISVVIFSRNYADSRWCLEELREIMEYKKESPSQMVLPVFYDVDPSDVRKQTGLFEGAFAKHDEEMEEETVARWRAALTEAGSLSGWDVTNPANGTEAKISKDIAQRIYDELNDAYLDVAVYPVGLECRIMQVKKHLNDCSNDVRFIVIWGIGGIGKTTLANAVYNQFSHSFEAKCFLTNIGEKSKHRNGLVRLQEHLLRDIVQYEKTVESVNRGSIVIKERLRSRRVLVILDDLTQRDQLMALARNREWFGFGSRIIITTRDLDSVKEIKADFTYMVEELNDDESLELFSMHAFGSSHPEEGFAELSKEIVNYCKGLPLALEILGASLLDRSVGEWKSELHKIRRTPNDDIHKKLEISYDLLGNHEKDLFLHISCFFVGWDKYGVSKILDACDFSVDSGLGILIRRNLVKVTYSSESHRYIWKLEMHDLIRDMGKEIVRRESRNPGERSRLFSHEDILTAMRSHLGTGKVEGLVMQHTLEFTNETEVDAKSFDGMKRLRILCLQNIHVIGDYGYFSKELRWLHWHGFPLESLPDEFYMGNLIIMDMQRSKIRALWEAPKTLEHLKVLNLSQSHFLTKTPDFTKLPSLEDVIMMDCIELREVDASIGDLKRLARLYLSGCKELESIPSSICRVRSLEYLNIRGCSKIKQLPDDFGELESLTQFIADGAPIEHLPSSIINLKNLSRLTLRGCNFPRSSSISMLGWSFRKGH